MKDKILSIITNFGCDTGCEYCIWKGHKLSANKTSVDSTNWDELKKQISTLSKSVISVSGGGDPLYKYTENNEWWKMLFSIADKTKIELHTSKLVQDWEHITKLERYVLHIENNSFETIKTNLIVLSKIVKLRLVFVMNNSMIEEELFDIAKFCETNNIELSFRLLMANNKEQYIMHEFMRRYHKILWYYIEQNDYNLYYMPDNKIYDKYLI